MIDLFEKMEVTQCYSALGNQFLETFICDRDIVL